jgi:hypothetical protein
MKQLADRVWPEVPVALTQGLCAALAARRRGDGWVLHVGRTGGVGEPRTETTSSTTVMTTCVDA